MSRKNNKQKIDLNEKLNSFITFLNGFEVMKHKFSKGEVSFNDLLNYNISLFNRRSAFIDLYYNNSKQFEVECNFNKRDFINLLNY